MRPLKAASIAVPFVFVALFGAACSNDADVEGEASFAITGQVNEILVDDELAALDIPGDLDTEVAMVVRPEGTTGVEDCISPDGTLTIYLDNGLELDDEVTEGSTVDINGEIEDDADGGECVLVAESVARARAGAGTGNGTGNGAGTDDTSPEPKASPDGTADPDATPGPADEGSIVDQTPSISPEES